jgi:methionine sulfoxide reductase catalytic subunit
MLIKVTRKSDVKTSEITDETVYRQRRRFIQGLAGTGLLLASSCYAAEPAAPARTGKKLKAARNGAYSTKEETTPYKDVTQYNNFYELGTDKGDPSLNAALLKTKPWTLAVEGECAKPAVYQLEDFIKPHKLEERVYRLRCVEGWSMVIPWVGFPLAEVIKRSEPTSKAKYVAFETIHAPKMLPGQRIPVLQWPYKEGLRIDEAMHPLSLLAVGLYGEVLPNQNGAPIRLVVPWKYGFKSIKSIIKIRFTEEQPVTAWNQSAPDEYGFYSNVNPNVDHPRWSQARERRIGEFFKQPTLKFNGYEEEVGRLYAGMDLKRFF